MNGAQIHLAFNHLPVVGAIFSLVFLIIGMKFEALKKAGLILLVAASIAALPAFFSGEPAEDIAKPLPGVTKQLIHDHEEAAEAAAIVLVIAGLAAALQMVLAHKGREPKALGIVTLLLTLAATLAMANTAHKGGLIRHDEIRANFIQQGAASHTEEHHD